MVISWIWMSPVL